MSGRRRKGRWIRFETGWNLDWRRFDKALPATDALEAEGLSFHAFMLAVHVGGDPEVRVSAWGLDGH